MPTYDYECGNCEHTFELFQGINDPVKRKCPECGRLKLRRLIGPGAAIIFKGSGFYQTDYRSESYKKGAEAQRKSSEAAKSEGGKSEGGKSEGGKSEGGKSEGKSSSKSDSGKSSGGKKKE